MNDVTYSRFYNEDTSRNWSPHPDINVLFITQTRNFCNDALRSRGHLFLNEVYDQLGLSRTRQGQVVGWLYNDDKSLVDFGNLEGDGLSILLVFNPDGEIVDKLEEEKHVP